ncbi:hypothetical protein A0U87_11445 [Sphingobium sp. MP9-4]|jgi:hypothetical protein|nr:hypothetical protein A0U87_11445 [Sphingobium sp. MP9-4]
MQVGFISDWTSLRDRYVRPVAQVYSGDKHLVCEQLLRGYAVYEAKWDNGQRLARVCKAAR